MRIARNHGFVKSFGNIHQSRLQVAGKHVDLIHLFTKPKPKGGRNLIISAAAGVELSARIADGLDELCLDE